MKWKFKSTELEVESIGQRHIALPPVKVRKVRDWVRRPRNVIIGKRQLKITASRTRTLRRITKATLIGCPAT